MGLPYFLVFKIDSTSRTMDLYFPPSGGHLVALLGTTDTNVGWDVGPDSIIYVGKNVEHRFHSIEEELKVLVFFAPAEFTGKG